MASGVSTAALAICGVVITFGRRSGDHPHLPARLEDIKSCSGNRALLRASVSAA